MTPRPRGGTWVRPDGSIDSVQWIDLDGRAARLDLAALERAYFAWVPRISAGLMGPEPGGAGRDAPLRLGVRPWTWPEAIRMATPGVTPGRRSRAILGGLLAHAGGSLAFEAEPRGGLTRIRVALLGFRPRLPLAVYLRTQRRLHERSTYAFLREVACGLSEVDSQVA